MRWRLGLGRRSVGRIRVARTGWADERGCQGGWLGGSFGGPTAFGDFNPWKSVMGLAD